MADIQISCPECGNKRGVPEQLVGKKIKCKKCQAVFVVKAASAKSATSRSDGAIPIKKEEEDDRTAYALRDESLATRCPFCALPMDPPDAKICLNCGYDMLKRRRVDRKVVYERTFADYLLWHLPTIGLTLLVFIVIGVTIFLCIRVYPEQFDNAVLPPGCFQVWTVIIMLFVVYKSGRFIVRRLFREFNPPEKEKRGEELEEE